MTAMNFVDASLHGSSVPSTYIAPGILQWFGVASTQGSTTGTLPASPQSGVYGSNTYTVLPGNIVQGPDADVVAGYFTSNGNLTVIPVGLYPTNIEIFNDTDGIGWKWMAGMASTHTWKLTDTGPVLSDDTGSAIVVTADAAGGNGDVCYVALSATLCGSSKTICFRIEA